MSLIARLGLMACLVSSGCERGRSVSLPAADAGLAPDAEFALDAVSAPDVRDAEPAPDRDAGSADRILVEDAGGCPLGPIEVYFAPSGGRVGFDGGTRLTGRARVESWLPNLVLAFENGQSVSIRGSVVGTTWPDPLPSTVVEADVVLRFPFWSEVAFDLRTVGTSSSASFTGWTESMSRVSVRDGRLGSSPSACLLERGCAAETRPLELIAPLPDGTSVRVGAGQKVDRGTTAVVNSASSVEYRGELRCSDAPPVWTSGFVSQR